MNIIPEKDTLGEPDKENEHKNIQKEFPKDSPSNPVPLWSSLSKQNIEIL